MSDMVINAKKFSDIVLVYDQYYAKKPKAALLLMQRIALCCGVCLCAMMFLLAEYRIPVSSWTAAGLSLLFSAGFSLLFTFVKKRFAIPAVLAICGVIGVFNREIILDKLSYFADAMWLVMDGRFVPGKVLVDHNLNLLTPQNQIFCDGTAFGFGLVIFLFSMITAACLFPKPMAFPSLLIWIALWTPVLVSEHFTFSFWIIPALALYMGTLALTSVYGQGVALGRIFDGDYHEAAVRGERNFKNSLARVSFLKQVEMRTAYFSKYFSSAMYVMAVFAALGIAAGGVFSSSSGIDYTKLYDFVRSLGEHSPFTNPFEKGPASEWFADPSKGNSVNDQTLSITTPGRGNQEILRVKNTGNVAVYLRGDIGIDFTGESWTTPIFNEPELWKTRGLADYYRPVEMQILKTLQEMQDAGVRSVSEADITVDYLCDSMVTFLPAYTSDFGYFDNEMFKIYGDFVARVNEGYDKMDSVYCTALVPDYTNMDNSLTADGLNSLRSAVVLAQGSGGISDILNGGGYFTGHTKAFTSYKNYVRDTYMRVPEKYQVMIRDYVYDKGFYNMAAAMGAEDELVKRYLIADMVANYLRSNYTYSLNINNSGANPLNSFLNETKSGHCAMYASSMTLILREMGIPARYCSGFVVQPNGGESTVLRSKNLHAWVEVYLDELGWVTFDPTSSSQTGTNPGETSRPDLSTPSLNSNPESSASSESSSESSQESEGSSDTSEESDNSSQVFSGEIPPDNNKTDINVLPYILAILAVTAAVIPVLLSIRYYKKLKERALNAIKKIRAAGNTDLLLEKILLVMKICGVKQSPGEMPGKFYARAEKAFACSIKDYRGALRAAAFSGEALEATDCARLAGLLERLYNAAEKQLKPIGRIRLRKALLNRKSS